MLIQFNLPQNLNGGKLITEIETAGITVNTDTSPARDGAGNFWLDIDASKETEPKAVVDAHNG